VSQEFKQQEMNCIKHGIPSNLEWPKRIIKNKYREPTN